jgi:hypothetical protein
MTSSRRNEIVLHLNPGSRPTEIKKIEKNYHFKFLLRIVLNLEETAPHQIVKVDCFKTTMSAHSHKHKHGKMKGVHTGTTAFSISVKEAPIPKIVNQTDAIICPTSAGICGSDLHILHGRIKITGPLTI